MNANPAMLRPSPPPALPAGAAASVKSAARAIDIVEHVAGAPTSPTAQMLSDALDIPASSLSYLLATLVARGWLQLGERRTYAIGPALTGLVASGPTTPVERAGPVVRELRRQLNETCGYYEARGTELVALLSELGHQALNYAMQVGERGPLHAFAAGKALLAFGPEEAREAYLARGQLERYTAATLANAEELSADLRLTSGRGYALSVGEHTPGLVSIAVPVGDERLGALSVAVPAVRWDAGLQARILSLLNTAQARLGAGPESER